MPGAVAALAVVAEGDPERWNAGVFGWLGLPFLPCKPLPDVPGGMPCPGLLVVGLSDRRGFWVIEREAERRTQRFGELPARRVPNFWPLRQCFRQDAGLLVLAARTHENLGEAETAGRVAAHALEAAAAPERRVAAVRPGAGRDRIRPGPDRPTAAPADQPGHHAGLPRPVRTGLRRGRAGPAARRSGRHDDAAGSGALRPGPAAVRNGTVGRGAGRAGDRAQGPTRHGTTWPRPNPTPSGSETVPSASWPWPAAWTASRPARWRRRWPR
jgi:hypothetical protein